MKNVQLTNKRRVNRELWTAGAGAGAPVCGRGNEAGLVTSSDGGGKRVQKMKKPTEVDFVIFILNMA